LSGTPVLELVHVSRSFGPVEVLHDLNFALVPGRVHALIGENGAGKSTAMKILCGYLEPTEGEVRLDGAPAHFRTAQEAEARGIAMIHQEFNLAEQLSVEENMFLGREKRKGWRLLNKAEMQAEAGALLRQLGMVADVRTRISDLSVSDKQMVEIGKALLRKVRVLVMDEPTAVLTNREASVLFDQIARLKAEGVAILYTSHKLDEIARIADDVTVLRDGNVVVHGVVGEFDEDRMARDMVGRDLKNLFPETHDPGTAKVLEIRNLSVPGRVFDLSFDLKKGEVLGLAGLVGAGRTEAMEGLMGLRPATADVQVNGKAVVIRDMADAVAAGLGYLTEDRKGRGLILGQSLTPNLTLLALKKFVRRLIDKKAEEKAMDEAIQTFDIRAPSRQVAVKNLSGGNQQKLLLAKTMLGEPEIVIIDEPTRGIDIGTKQQIYQFIRKLADEGKSVIVVSSEMAEIIGLSDRVVVMRHGRKAGELARNEITEDAVVRLAMGLDGQEYAA